MSLFHLKVGNLSPVLRATLYAPDGNPQDLSGATVNLHVHRPDGTILFDRAVSAIEDITGGVVRYDWQLGDTATPGRYRAEFHATLGSVEATYPNDRDLIVMIHGALGDQGVQITTATSVASANDVTVVAT